MTDSQPLVSVVVAAFNAATYIEETCTSALRQTYPAIELIVVDDGSTDDTASIVSALAAKDPRIHIIQQANQGVAAARNRGIAAASGEFIAPLDADDVWDATKIAQQVGRMIEAGPDAGLVYCWWAWIDAQGFVLDRSPRWRVSGRVLERLAEINFTGSASVPMYRTAIVREAGGYRTQFRAQQAQGCEDWDLALRVAEHHAVAVVPVVLVGYRRHLAGMSSNCDTMWRSQLAATADLERRVPSLPKPILRRSRGQFALHLAGVSFWSGSYLRAVRWGLKAPLTLQWAILPHVARILARRTFSPGPSRIPLGQNGHIDLTGFPEPLLPYDRIYERHWRRE